MKSIILILFLLLAACSSGGGGSKPKIIWEGGWMPADVWHTLPATLVDLAASQGFRFVGTEDAPSAQEGHNRDSEHALATFQEHARAWNAKACRNGQIHVVFLVNWNQRYVRNLSDAAFESIVQGMLNSYDPACTWIEPVVEPDEGDRAKARRFTKRVADAWPGKIIIPAAGEGWSEIRRDFVDRHPSSKAQAEQMLNTRNPNLLVITDSPPLLDPMTQAQHYPGLVRLSRETGTRFILYTDRYAPNDPNLHEAVIRKLAEGLS